MGWLIWKSFFEIFRLCEYKLTNSQNSSFPQQKAAIYLKNLHILIISSHRGQSSTQQYNNFQEKTKKTEKNPQLRILSSAAQRFLIPSFQNHLCWSHEESPWETKFLPVSLPLFLPSAPAPLWAVSQNHTARLAWVGVQKLF